MGFLMCDGVLKIRNEKKIKPFYLIIKKLFTPLKYSKPLKEIKSS